MHPRALGPLHTRPKGRHHVIVMALDSHSKVVALTWYVNICVKPTFCGGLTQIPAYHET